MTYVSERDDYNIPAKRSEAWAWMWEQKIVCRKKPSQREISNALCWKRHQVRALQNDFDAFCVHYFNKSGPQILPLGDDYKATIKKKATKTPPPSPLFAPAKNAPIVKEKTSLLLVKLSKGLSIDYLTKDMIEVFNHWYKFRSSVRSFRKDQAKILKSALQNHTVEELKAIVDYCFTADDSLPYIKAWRENGYTDICNLLNRDKVERNVEIAQDWKSGKSSIPKKITTMSAMPPTTNNKPRMGLDISGE